MKTKNIRKVLSDNVKYYRFKLGLTQEELAEKCDVSPRYLSDIENSRGNIPIDTLEVIAYNLKLEEQQASMMLATPEEIISNNSTKSKKI